MAQEYFYPQTSLNIVVSLSNMFIGKTIHIYDVSGNDTGDVVKIPVSFGPADTAYQRRKADLNEGNTKYYSQFPKIGILMKGFKFAPERTQGQNQFLYYYPVDGSTVDLSEILNQLQPTPVDFEFEIQVRTNYMQDMLQIVEQIMPYFRPQQNIRIKEFSFLNLERDFRVVLKDWPIEFDQPFEEEERRVVQSNISVIVHGFLYMPLETDNGSLIKSIDARFWVNSLATTNVTLTNLNLSGTDVATEVFDYSVSAISSIDLSAVNISPSQYQISAYDTNLNAYLFVSATDHQ